MKTILVLEDDMALNDGISYSLQKEKYHVVCAYTIKEAMDICREVTLDIAILDVNLPDGDGFALCKWIREQYKIPVLFLSARDLEEDMLQGYELGADDYVTKPFSMKVLLKKIEVIVSRNITSDINQYNDGYLCVDFDTGKVYINNEECGITPTEYRMIKKFIEHKGKLLTYTLLLDYSWDNGSQFVDKHALAVNVNRLRNKIEDDEHTYISNVYGMGYLWK